MSFYVGKEFESGSDWDSPPKYCPFCGGKNIYNDVGTRVGATLKLLEN